MLKNLRILALFCEVVTTSLAWGSGGACAAQQQIVLTGDQSQLVQLPDEPATVVVGNPSIADVTTEGRMLMFHPRGFGVTNVIVLDAAGRRLGDFLVHIVYEDSYGVAVYSPAGRESFSCRKECEPVMRIGDVTGFFDDYRKQARDRNSLAAAQALGEDLLVPPYNNGVTILAPASPN